MRDYWDKWFQKFFSLFISIKFLSIVILAVFRVIDLITGGQFITGLLGVLGIRGIIQVRRVMNNYKEKKIIGSTIPPK